MVKISLLALFCCAPLAASPAIAATANTSKTPVAAKPATGTVAARQQASRPSAKRRSQSRVRIYTVRPEMFEPRTKPGASVSSDTQSVTISDAKRDPFLGFTPTDNSLVGVGLWRIPKTDALDPNRSRPLRETAGKTSRAAAVGLQFSF